MATEEVAVRLAMGMTNRQIAEGTFLSVRTVEGQSQIDTRRSTTGLRGARSAAAARSRPDTQILGGRSQVERGKPPWLPLPHDPVHSLDHALPVGLAEVV